MKLKKLEDIWDETTTKKMSLPVTMVRENTVSLIGAPPLNSFTPVKSFKDPVSITVKSKFLLIIIIHTYRKFHTNS